MGTVKRIFDLYQVITFTDSENEHVTPLNKISLVIFVKYKFYKKVLLKSLALLGQKTEKYDGQFS